VKSDTLAATHFKNRHIRENQCYSCHSDYGLGGHDHGQARRTRPRVSIHDRALHRADRYRRAVSELPVPGLPRRVAAIPEFTHQKDMLPELMSGKTRCLDCHAPAHPEGKKEARL
jgi:cytochrome c nitrite reductase small subunit